MAPRALDHIVWPTRDLDALADTFGRLGFTVGRRNRHPWGTVNHIVQFDGCFLELLGFAEDYRPVPPDDPAFPFAGFCSDFLAHSSGGAAMLVLRSADATADAASFCRRGLGVGRLLPFSRAAQGPDGSDRTVAFTVAFAALPGLPEIGAFTCQQHRPENFWSPAAQRHANGVVGVGAVVVEAKDVAAARSALRRFTGQDDPDMVSDRDAIPLANSLINLVAAPHGGTASKSRSRVSELRFDVRDLAAFERGLDEAHIPFSTQDHNVSVAAVVAGGTDLVFRARQG